MFTVWHFTGTGNETEDRYLRWTSSAAQYWPSAYTKVAEVEADGLEEVFGLTNSVYSPWWENPGADTLVGPTRSTSVGDVVVDPAGRKWVVAPVGFEELDPPEIEPAFLR